METMTMGNRWDGMDQQQKHVLERDLERIAGSLSLGDDSAIKAAEEKFFRYHTWDHFTRFIHTVSKALDVDPEIRQRLNALRAYETNEFPSENQIQETLEAYSSKLEATHHELLQDYLHYRDHHTLRRPQALAPPK